MTVKFGMYKGHPTVALYQASDTDFKYPFSFGIGKAILILQHIEHIQAFVKQHAGGPAAQALGDSNKEAEELLKKFGAA